MIWKLAIVLMVGCPSTSYAQLPCDPLADFTYTIYGCDVLFQPLTNTAGLPHFWTFETTGVGYTSASNLTTPLHTFGGSTGVTRTVTHTVTIAGVVYTCSKEIRVNCTEGCDDRAFSYSVNGCTVTFYAPNSIQNWSFGDGNTSTLTNPTYNYTMSGDYTVTYTNPSGVVCQKTIRVECGHGSSCCTAAFTGEVTRNCSVLNLALSAECTDTGTHSWTISPNIPTACMTLVNFFQGMPTQGMIQITNINTCEVTSLRVTHQFTCSNGTVLTQTQYLPIQDQGIFIGENGTTTLLTDYNCVLPGSIYSGPCTVYSSGIVTVDKDFTFTSANVRVHPGLAGFDVIKNFTLNQNTLVSGNSEPECNCLWRGIYVYGANTMTTDTDASIQDALYAIRAGFKNFLNIKKTLFLRNFVGIRSTDGPFNLVAFEENRFDGNGPLKEICSLDPLNDLVVAQMGNQWCDIAVPYQSGSGFAGLFIRDAGSLNLPPLVFSKQNLFYDLAVGVDAADTDLSIHQDSRFENIMPSSSAYDIPFGGMAVRYVDSENKGVNSIRFIGNGKFFAGTPDINNCTFGIYLSSRISATVNTGTGIHILGTRIVGAHNGIFLSNNCGTSATFSGSRGGFFRGIGNNYIEVNPNTGNLYSTVIPLSGILLTDFDPSQSAPEFWQNTIDVNQDDPCGTFSFGIRANAFNLAGQALEQVDVNQNIINVNDGFAGIFLSNYVGAWVHDNSNSSFTGAGIFLNSQSSCPANNIDFSVGISVVGGNNNLTGCNDVLSIPSGNHDHVVSLHRDGIFVRNNLVGGRFGARFGLLCTGTRFACNTMSNYSENGLRYANGANTGPQGTFATMTHGNVWMTNNPALTDAFIDLANTNPNSSRYFVRALPGENPSNNAPPITPWFSANVPNSINPTCYYDCPITAPQALAAELTAGDSAVAMESIAYGYYPEVSEWTDKRNLLEKLTQNPSLCTDNFLMGGFKTDHQYAPMGQLLSVNNSIVNLFALNEAQKAALESYSELAIELLVQLEQADSIGSTLLNAMEKEANQSLRDSLGEMLEALQEASDSFAMVLSGQRVAGIPAVLADLEAIAPNNLYEANEKYVLGVYSQALFQGYQPSSEALNNLLTIGSECPMVNGPCVYNARSLYEKFTGMVLPDVDCPEDGNRPQGRNDGSSTYFAEITLYPNPTDNALTVMLPHGIGEGEYRLEFSNVLGKVVLRAPIILGSNQVFVGNLSNGLYFAKTTRNGVGIFAKPIFIQR